MTPCAAGAAQPISVMASESAAVDASAAIDRIDLSEVHGWPTFAGELDGSAVRPPALSATSVPLPVPGTDTITVSAPLPPAVFTGAFMLGGQWVVSMLWKKRKI
jgi:hypothetical protein